MSGRIEEPASGTPVPPVRRLTRSRSDRMVAGVCGGVAEYTGLDGNVVRLLAVLVVLFGAFLPVIAYVVAWVLLPEEP